MDVGLKIAVTFGPGSPLAVKLTAPLNPPDPVRVMVELTPDPPRTAVRDVGDADIVKLPGEFRINVIGELALKLPLVPFTVMG
jgi:hypothetical protein